MSYSIPILILLIVLLGSYTTKAQVPQSEVDALNWIIKQYKVSQTPSSINNTVCNDFPSLVSCIIIGTNSYVKTITIGGASNDNGMPDPLITTLAFQQLTFITIYKNNDFVVANSTFNILGLLNAPNLQNCVIYNDPSISPIPDSFGINSIKLVALSLQNCSLNIIPNSILKNPLLANLNVDMNPIDKFELNGKNSGIATLTFGVGKSLIELGSESFSSLIALSISAYGHGGSVQFDYYLSTVVQNINLYSYPNTSITYTFKNFLSLQTLNLNANLQVVNISSDLSHLTNLNTISIRNMAVIIFPISKLPYNCTFQYITSRARILPSKIIGPRVLGLSLNRFAGSLPTVGFLDPTVTQTFDISNNTDLSGSVPEVFCQIRKMIFDYTSISDVPSCIKCYNYYSTLTLPNQPFSFKGVPFSLAPAYNCTDYQVYSSNGLRYGANDNQNIIISGRNLGWGVVNDSSANLTVLIPNSQYKYRIDLLKSTETITFSEHRGIRYNVTYYLSQIVIGDVEMKQLNHSINITVPIDINQNIPHTIYMNGQVQPFSLYNLGIFNKVVLQVLLNGPYNFTVTNEFNTVTKIYQFKYKYPIITSISKITTDGGILNMTGSFGIPQEDNVEVMIAGEICTLTTITPTFIACNRSRFSTFGLVPVQMTIDGFVFQSNTLLNVYATGYYNIDQCIKTTNNCSGNGECMADGTCLCRPGWYGITCNTKPYQGGEIGNGSQVIINANNFSFSFPMVAVQEIDIQGLIASEVIIKQWNLIGNITNATTGWTYTYQLNNSIQYNTIKSSNTNITTSIEYSRNGKQYTFAGITKTLPPNSLKLSTQIQGWTFKSSLNTLRVVFSTPYVPATRDCDNQHQSGSQFISSKDGNSLQYIRLINNGVQFVGSFLESAISDGKITYSSNRVINQTGDLSYIGITLPQCDQCILDPDFTALIYKENDSGNGNNDCNNNDDANSHFEGWKIGLIVGLVGGSILIVSIVVLLKSRTFKMMKQSMIDRIKMKELKR